MLVRFLENDMRILFLSPVGVIGGAERVLLTAINGLRRVEPRAVIRVIAPVDGSLLRTASEAGAETEVVPMPPMLTRLGDSQLRSAGKWQSRKELLKLAAWTLPQASDYLARLRAAVTRFRPDLVHSNGIKTHLLSRVVVPPGIPVVWHLHDFYGLRPLASWLLRRARTRVRAGIAISQAVAADAAKVLPGVPIKRVMNAVDLNRFCPGPAVISTNLLTYPPFPPALCRSV